MRWLLLLTLAVCLISGCSSGRPEEEMSQERIDAARERVKQGEDATPNMPGGGM